MEKGIISMIKRMKVVKTEAIDTLIQEAKVLYICHISLDNIIVEYDDILLDMTPYETEPINPGEEWALRKFWRFQSSEVHDIHLELNRTKYTEEERNTWEFQASAAKEVLAGETSAATINLGILADSKDKTIEELASSILLKKGTYEATVFNILSSKAKKLKFIDTCTIEELLYLKTYWALGEE